MQWGHVLNLPMSQDRSSSSTNSQPGEGVALGAGLPQEAAEGSRRDRCTGWRTAAVQEAADPDEELTV